MQAPVLAGLSLPGECGGGEPGGSEERSATLRGMDRERLTPQPLTECARA